MEAASVLEEKEKKMKSVKSKEFSMPRLPKIGVPRKMNPARSSTTLKIRDKQQAPPLIKTPSTDFGFPLDSRRSDLGLFLESKRVHSILSGHKIQSRNPKKLQF